MKRLFLLVILCGCTSHQTFLTEETDRTEIKELKQTIADLKLEVFALRLRNNTQDQKLEQLVHQIELRVIDEQSIHRRLVRLECKP